MVILYVIGAQSLEDQTNIAEWKEANHIIRVMTPERLVSYLRFDRATGMAFVDAIVCVADSVVYAAEGPYELSLSLDGAMRLARDVKALPENCAMRDGRQWKSIPFIVMGMLGPYNQVEQAGGISIIRYEGPDVTMKAIQQIVNQYRQMVLAEYESFGILVRVINGRTQVGPALKKKHPDVQGSYYYSAADRRDNAGWVTVMRDKEGVRHEIDLFTQLIDMGATETQMHTFFEEHPAFLMEARLGVPISHPVNFARPTDWKPDFAISPILGPVDGDVPELLELKGPAEKLLSGKLHRGFSAKVHHAVDQVRDYDRTLRDPANFEALRKGLGYIPSSSKLAVLIGRLPKSAGDIEVFTQRSSELDVQIVTYDEILQTQERNSLR